MLVVDTDVISYLFKQDIRADLYKSHLQGQLLLISPMTRAELEAERCRALVDVDKRPILTAALVALQINATDPGTRQGKGGNLLQGLQRLCWGLDA